MNTRLTAAALVAACALIGPAHADPTYTAQQAIRSSLLAGLAESECPGIKVNQTKVNESLRVVDSVYADADSYLHAVIQEDDSLRSKKLDARTLCAAARDPSFPFHFLLDIEN
jgi:hypothetical protein